SFPNNWNVWNDWNYWNVLFPLHQKRHNDVRQLLRLFVRNVMPRAFDRDDFRVGKKLGAAAAHRFHEIALGAVDKQDRTFEPANESLDLPFGHRRGRESAEKYSAAIWPRIRATRAETESRRTPCPSIARQ